MIPNGTLIAWIKPCGSGEFVGAFVGDDTNRAPATKRCRSSDIARKWVEDEASAFGLPVKWIDETPRL